MIVVSVVEAKARFSKYLEQASAGERVVICRHNKPVAELRPVENVRLDPRPIGPLPGRPTFEVPRTFFDPLPDDELDRWDQVSPADPLGDAWTLANRARSSKVAEKATTYRASSSRRAAKRR